MSRFDAERRLLRAERGADRYDSSAWSVLALVAATPRLPGVEAVLNPPVPGPPRFEVRTVRAAGADLVIELDESGRVFERRFSELDLNLLLSRFADHLPDHLSPRLHAHAVVSIFDLLDRTTDLTTREALDLQTRRSLELLLRRQSENGGWPYGRKSQASVVHSAGGARQSIFPDLQYTIDTVVPGLALARAYTHTGEARYLESAVRGFRFLEDHVGRVDWQGRPLWKLYPGDDKTARSGSAVNYELWVGAFFASLAEITTDSLLRDNIAGYLDDIVDYSASLTTDVGDIAYGDYVRELRTPYASWVAMLLADIGRHAGHRGATQLAERLVDRLAAVMLPSGALPNVVDYARKIGGYEVPAAHRHGIGVYPLRAYYQLYFVAAAAAVRRQPEAAARAFAFVAVTMLDPTFGAATAGYSARGDRDGSPAELWRIGRDWLLTASAALPWFAELDYHPVFTHIAPEAARLEAMATDFRSAARDRVADRETRPLVMPDEHPLGADARRVLAAAAGGRGPDPADVAAVVSGQAPNGLWRAPPEAPSGDQRTVDVLLPLVEAKLAGVRDEQLDAVIVRGVSGAWVKLFHPTQGIGYLKPPRNGRMPPNLVGEYALTFALAQTAGVESARELGFGWSRLILRYLVTSQRALDGRPRLDHRGHALEGHEATRTADAVQRTVSLLLRH